MMSLRILCTYLSKSIIEVVVIVSYCRVVAIFQQPKVSSLACPAVKSRHAVNQSYLP